MAYIANPVTFDGTNDWLVRGGGLTGAADGVNGTISLWFRRAGTGANYSILNAQAVRMAVIFNTSDDLLVQFRNVASAQIFLATFSAITDSNWHHVIASTSGVAGQAYLDDVSATPSILSNESIDWTLTNFSVGATVTGTQIFPGDLADVWFDDSSLDLTVVSNRRKFRLVNGSPEDLGSDGSIPTGGAPLGFFGGATADWHTNKGTGGGFTENGALTDGEVPLPAARKFILTRPA